MKVEYISKGADLSKDERYRYRLWREWRGSGTSKTWRWLGGKDGSGYELGEPLSCLFIMLNPSTADGENDDPTIRRCVSYARLWGYDRLEVLNLFAYRTSKPSELLALTHLDDPVGPSNKDSFDRAVPDAGIVVCAWGTSGSHLDQDETALGWIGDRKCYSLGVNSDGSPKHPLYLPATARLMPFSGRKRQCVPRKKARGL